MMEHRNSKAQRLFKRNLMHAYDMSEDVYERLTSVQVERLDNAQLEHIVKLLEEARALLVQEHVAVVKQVQHA